MDNFYESELSLINLKASFVYLCCKGVDQNHHLITKITATSFFKVIFLQTILYYFLAQFFIGPVGFERFHFSDSISGHNVHHNITKKHLFCSCRPILN